MWGRRLTQAALAASCSPRLSVVSDLSRERPPAGDLAVGAGAVGEVEEKRQLGFSVMHGGFDFLSS